jgi:hypothetical protein
MEIETIKKKILSGKLTDEEIVTLLQELAGNEKGESTFLTVVKSLIKSYLMPRMWKLIIETVLIIIAVTAILILSSTGKIDATVTAVLLAFSLGFLFGRIR